MTIRVALHHQTRYRFDRPVALSPHEIRLRPRRTCRTPILGYSLKIEPGEALHQLAAGRRTATTSRASCSRRRRASWPSTVDLVADMTVINPFDFFVERYADQLPVRLSAAARLRARPLPRARAPGPAAGEWLASFRASGYRAGENTVDISGRAQRAAAGRDPLPGAHGARRPDARRDAGELLAARAATPAGCWCRSCATSASPRASSPAIWCSSIADVKPLDGPAGTGRLHRSARVGRGLPPRRGLDRPRSHLRSARRRRPHPARRDRVPVQRRAGHGLHRPVRVDPRISR